MVKRTIRRTGHGPALSGEQSPERDEAVWWFSHCRVVALTSLTHQLPPHSSFWRGHGQNKRHGLTDPNSGRERECHPCAGSPLAPSWPNERARPRDAEDSSSSWGNEKQGKQDLP